MLPLQPGLRSFVKSRITGKQTSDTKSVCIYIRLRSVRLLADLRELSLPCFWYELHNSLPGANSSFLRIIHTTVQVCPASCTVQVVVVVLCI